MDAPSDPRPGPPRSPLNWALTVGATVLVLGLLGLLAYRIVLGNQAKELLAAIREGKKPHAPNFRHRVIWPHGENWPDSLQSVVRSGSVSLSDLLGHPVVINFWASWCIPCAHEAPRLNASAKQHRGEVVFLGIDVKDFTPDARKFLRKHHVNYVAVHARGDSTYTRYGLTGVPETYYLDARGRIVDHSLGEISRRELEAGIAKTRSAP